MVMVLGLFLGALAGPATAVLATPTPVVTIYSPANNTYTNHGYMYVNWTVTVVTSDIWNYTRTYAVGATPPAYTNVSEASSVNHTLANGTYKTDVFVVHWNGTGYQNSTVKSVTYTIDQNAPTIVSTLPSGSAVPLATHLVVVFSEAMKSSTVTVSLTPAAVVKGDNTWSPDGKTVTIYVELAYSTTFTANVAGKDLAGNALTGRHTYSFSSLTWVYGVLVDSNNKALSNATVTLTPPSGGTVITTTSSSTGQIGVLVPANTYAIKITLSGYNTVDKTGVTVGPGLTANNLGTVTMGTTMDWTIPIVIIVIGIIVIVVIVAVARRK
jgi:hypothetical protein